MAKEPEMTEWEQTIVAVSNQHAWGKGATLVEALEKCQVSLIPMFKDEVKFEEHVALRAYNCSGDKLSISEIDGSIQYPSNVTSISLGEFKAIDLVTSVDVLITADDLIRKFTDHTRARKPYEDVECEAMDKAEDYDRDKWEAKKAEEAADGNKDDQDV